MVQKSSDNNDRSGSRTIDATSSRSRRGIDAGTASVSAAAPASSSSAASAAATVGSITAANERAGARQSTRATLARTSHAEGGSADVSSSEKTSRYSSEGSEDSCEGGGEAAPRRRDCSS
eukprot:GHVU01204786.1.p2 GENE.GHVU01204786.1~~GHVU01204786.1.p2  ORF type:complete len:120 (+),score=19.93 GHVU01204786.1:1297-1656(+)